MSIVPKAFIFINSAVIVKIILFFIFFVYSFTNIFAKNISFAILAE